MKTSCYYVNFQKSIKMILYIVIVVVSFVIGAALGGWIFYASMMRAYDNNPSAMLTALARHSRLAEIEDEETYYELEVEKVGSKIHVSFKDNGMFVAQGNTLDEAVDAAQERYPTMAFIYEIELADEEPSTN